MAGVVVLLSLSGCAYNISGIEQIDNNSYIINKVDYYMGDLWINGEVYRCEAQPDLSLNCYYIDTL